MQINSYDDLVLAIFRELVALCYKLCCFSKNTFYNIGSEGKDDKEDITWE